MKPLRMPSWRRIDPWLTAAVLAIVAVGMWTMAPLATGAGASATSDTRIELDVPITTSVTPAWQTGKSAVTLPTQSVPGVIHDVSSSGWRMTTNWTNGYEVRVRSTTAPALRGVNAVDGSGAKSSFQDYKTTGCPCAWSGADYERGIFGYSIAVDSASGAAPQDVSRWGTNSARKWRGFTKASYRAFATSGGAGQYSMSLMLRSMIPTGGVQLSGSYRAVLIVSVHPLM